MPNIWTHMLYGEQLTNELRLKLPSIEQYQTLFNLGCQGPDFLFYHQFLPWQKDQRMPELGNRMHREHCGTVLMDYMQQVQQIKDPVKREQAFVYFIGFLTHHLLDRNFHPYVHFKAGYRKWDHQRFEVLLDTMMMERIKDVATWNTPVWKEIDAGEQLSDEIVSILHDTAVHRFEVETIPKSFWQDAYRDMIRAQKLFFDPKGWKRVCTFGQIEPMVYKKSPLSLDCLNEHRREWGHPAVKDETYTHSVWDLWEIALQDGRTVLTALLDWMQPDQERVHIKKSAELHFQEVLGDISYDTGKDCASGLENRYAQPVW